VVLLWLLLLLLLLLLMLLLLLLLSRLTLGLVGWLRCVPYGGLLLALTGWHHRFGRKGDLGRRSSILKATTCLRVSCRACLRGGGSCVAILSRTALRILQRLGIRDASRRCWTALCGSLILVLLRGLGLLDIAWSLVGRKVGIVAHGDGLTLSGRCWD
jgi:hypothetical protein